MEQTTKKWILEENEKGIIAQVEIAIHIGSSYQGEKEIWAAPQFLINFKTGFMKRNDLDVFKESLLALGSTSFSYEYTIRTKVIFNHAEHHIYIGLNAPEFLLNFGNKISEWSEKHGDDLRRMVAAEAIKTMAKDLAS